MPEARSAPVPKKPKKKTPKAATKKAAVTRAPKKPKITTKTKPVTKKPVKKKAVIAKKAVVTKTKGRATKPVAAKSAARTKPKKDVESTTRQATQKTAPEVVLPTKMSIRSREKALVYAEYIEKKFERYTYPATMALGLCFVLIGSYATFNLKSFDNICIDSVCKSEVVGSADQTQEIYPSSTANVLSAIPERLSFDYPIVVEIEHVTDVEIYLNFTNPNGLQKTMPLEVSPMLTNKLRTTIPSSDLEPNDYRLKLKGYNTYTQEPVYIMLGTFLVEEPFEFAEFDDTSTFDQGSLSADDTTDAQEPDQAEVSTEITDDEFSLQSTNTSAIESNTIEDEFDTLPNQESSEIANTDELDSAEQPTEEIEEFDEVELDTSVTPLSIQLESSSTLSGRAAISINATNGYTSGVYSLRKALSHVYVLEEELVENQAVLYINTTELPNGTYVLEATVSDDDDASASHVRSVKINNQLPQLTLQSTTPETNLERPVMQTNDFLVSPTTESSSANAVSQPQDTEPATPITPTIESDQRLIATLADTTPQAEIDSPEPLIELHDSVSLKAQEQMRVTSVALDDIITRYSAALQSEDVDLIREASESFDTYKRSLVDTALKSEVDRFIVTELSDSLDVEIEIVKTKIKTFEAVRRERFDGETAVDTDKDGITDIDEKMLFGSDPLSADTDGDGFTDGAEIIKGFDPTNAAAEAAIEYRSPKETVGLVSSKNLIVETVAPEINIDSTKSKVSTNVKGKGLPNSFVTLYVYSTPTIVTVRTDADGSFEYTFTKELEDGEHQVFVALTDNTGDIVAQSAPFTFIKEAQAFTPVDANTAADGVTVATAEPSDSAALYQTVLAMSVLALGVLLILLGIGLRANRPEVVIVEAAT